MVVIVKSQGDSVFFLVGEDDLQNRSDQVGHSSGIGIQRLLGSGRERELVVSDLTALLEVTQRVQLTS